MFGTIKHAVTSKEGVIGMGIGAACSAPFVGIAVNHATKQKWLKEAKKIKKHRRHHHHHHSSSSQQPQGHKPHYQRGLFAAGVFYVVYFGKSVFWNTGFTSLPKLPENLTTISDGMFYDCTQLTSIEIPQNITRIDDTAFGRCPISEIDIPTSVTYIGVATFANCKNLTNIVIPNNVTDIGFNAFLGCSNLKTVTLSNNIVGIREGSFKECTSLESIVIPNGVKFIGKQAFESCSSLSSIDIPETVEEISEQAFFNCSSLTQLFIPKSVVTFNINKNDNHNVYNILKNGKRKKNGHIKKKTSNNMDSINTRIKHPCLRVLKCWAFICFWIIFFV